MSPQRKCLLLLLLLHAASAAHHVMTLPADRRPTRGAVSSGEEDEATWMRLPDLPRQVAKEAARLDPGSQCALDFQRYLDGLHNFTLWAVQMYDSSVKIPSGLVYGEVFQLGHFDECVSILTGELRGQYCLPSIRFSPLQQQPLPLDPYSYQFDQRGSAWLKIQFSGDARKIHRDEIYWALCVPSSCSVQQVRQAVSSAVRSMAPSLDVGVQVDLQDDDCSVTDEHVLDNAWDVAYLCLSLAFVLLTITATCYDSVCCSNDLDITKKAKKGVGEIFLLGFSLPRNYKRLTYKQDTIRALDDFHFMRFFFMLTIIAGHRMLISCGHAVFNGDAQDQIFSNVLSMFLPNGTLFVDGYFTLGAFTLSYFLMEDLKKTNKNILQLLAGVVNRYIRLTPTYFIILMFHVSVLPYLGSGPFWKSHVIREQVRCKTYWWTNILYINNYVGVEDMCMFQSWYLSVDFHLFILGIFLVWLIHHRPRIGWTVTGVITFLSVLVPFIEIYIQHIEPVIYPYPRLLKDPRLNKTFQTIYVKTHSRASPYMVGMIGGMLLYKARSSPFKIKKIWSYLLLFTNIIIDLALLFSAFVFFIPGHSFYPLEAAIYGSLSRPCLAVTVCFSIMLLTFGDMEFLHRFFSSRICIVLGRLSYGAYLIHTIPQLYDEGSLRLPRSLDAFTTIWMTIGDWCMAYAGSAVLYFLVEAPFRTASKLIFYKRS